MTPVLRELELEQLRDELERHRIAVIEAYKIRKWLDCKNITEERLSELLWVLAENEKTWPWKTARAEYRADGNGFGRIVIMLPSETMTSAKM